MLKSNIDVFFVTSFLCSLKFLLFHRIEYPKRLKNLWLSFVIGLYIFSEFSTTLIKGSTL